jgi:hypothetical protein
MISEITVIVKDDERSLRKKHLIYDVYAIDENDPILSQCIRDSEKEFGGEATDVQVKISMTVR